MKEEIKDADFILNLEKAGNLFSNDEKKLKEEYKKLIKLWHPDSNKNEKASLVFQKINELYQQALELIKDGKWESKGYLQLKRSGEIPISICYLFHQTFELGNIYICGQWILYLFDKDKKKYYENALKRINQFIFYDEYMEKEIKQYLPQFYHNKLNYGEAESGEFYIAVKQEKDTISLLDIKKYYQKNFYHKYTAWIISRLLNLACYFEFSKIVHNGITIQNCFISPKNHSVYLYGGFWYTTKQKEKMLGVPKQVYDSMPPNVKSTKCADSTTDLESIKAIGRELLESVKDVPKPFQKWLYAGCCDSALEEMERWDKVILDSYGKRKFVEMKLTQKEVYGFCCL